jgi:hypothetical protein
MTIPRLAAALTSLASLALGVVTLAGPAVPDEQWGSRGSVVNALGLLVFAAMAVALELLPGLLDAARFARAGCRVAQVGLGLMVVESAASQVHGGNTLGPVFLLGLLGALVGLLLVSAAGVRRRTWPAVVPFVALLVGVGAGDHGGFLVLGLAWAALAIGTGTGTPLSAAARTSTSRARS